MYYDDSKGECYQATEGTEVNYPNQNLIFGQQTYIACSIGFTLAELQAYCEGTHTFKQTDLEIFKQFYDKFNYVSKFGKASQYLKDDWIKVFYPDDSKAGIWNSDTKTCTGVVGLNLNILTSLIGFESSLQNYVIGAQVKEITDSWAFLSIDPEEKHYFQHIVTIQFSEIWSETLVAAKRNEGSFFVPKLPDDLFYPFNL